MRRFTLKIVANHAAYRVYNVDDDQMSEIDFPVSKTILLLFLLSRVLDV